MNIICYNRKCVWHSDYMIPEDGRPWVDICILAASRERIPSIDEKGKCAWCKVKWP